MNIAIKQKIKKNWSIQFLEHLLFRLCNCFTLSKRPIFIVFFTIIHRTLKMQKFCERKSYNITGCAKFWDTKRWTKFYLTLMPNPTTNPKMKLTNSTE